MTTNLDKSSLAALSLFELRPTEEKVYLTCLIHGSLSAQAIAKISGLKRTTVYGLCDYLQQKGLLKFYQQRSHRLFYAEHPSVLVKKAQENAREAATKAADLERNLPVLSMLYQRGDHQPYVQVFTGQEQIRQAVEGVLEQSPDEVLFVATPSILEDVLGKSHLERYLDRRVKLKIATRGIYTRDQLPNETYLGTTQNLREVRIALPDFTAPTYTGIYNNTVLLISNQVEATAVRITSKAYADTVRSWFEVLWKSLEQ